MLRRLWIGCAPAMALVLFGAVAARADEPAERLWLRLAQSDAPVRDTLVEAQKDEDKGPIVEMLLAPGKLGEYWLGLGVAAPNDEQRNELKMPEDQGLVVQQVVPDSPAAKAGLKTKDVLLKAGEKPLKTPMDLVGAVNEAKDKKLTLEVLRDGKQEQIEVTPTKRPPDAMPRLPAPDDMERIQKWLNELQGQAGERKPGQEFRQRIQIIRPGAILKDVLVEHSMPDDMTVTITKTGKKPAEIVVKQGDEKWEATEDHLDKLPEKIRPYVDRMLGRTEFNVRMLQPGELMPQPRFIPEQPRALGPEGRLEKRLDELNARIEKLSKSLEKLQAKPKPKKAPEAETREE